MPTTTLPTHDLTEDELVLVLSCVSMHRNDVNERWKASHNTEDRLRLDKLHVIQTKLRVLKSVD